MGASEPLTVEAAIEAALRRNHELVRAGLAARRGEVGVAEAESAFAVAWLPSGNIDTTSGVDTWAYGLMASRRLPWGTVVRVGGQAGRVETDDEDVAADRVAAVVEVRQPIFREFGTLVQWEGVRLAESRLRQVRRDYELQKQDLVLEVVDTFSTLIQLEREAEADEASRDRADRLYRLTRIRERQGRASRVATLRAELQLGQADSRAANTRERLYSARRRFAELLGYPPQTEFLLTSPPPLALALPTAEEAVRIALENRLDYAQVLDDLRDRNRAVAIAERVRWPELDLTARYTRFGDGNSLDEAAGLDNDDWFLGLSAGSEYNPTRNRSTIARAELDRRSAEETIRVFELSIARQVQQRIAAYERAQTEVGIARRNLVLAASRAELARRLFEMGRGDHFSVTDAEDAYVDAQNRWFDAESESSLSGYRLMRVLGTLLEPPATLKPPAPEGLS
jgi:outer membrane protein TolC